MGNCCCSCNDRKINLIYSCSGCADVGEIADKIARKLHQSKVGQMSCLAGIGADLSGFIVSAQNADANITVDGCGVLCGKKTLENKGVAAISINLTELGLIKGSSNIETVDLSDIYNKVVTKINKSL